MFGLRLFTAEHAQFADTTALHKFADTTVCMDNVVHVCVVHVVHK